MLGFVPQPPAYSEYLLSLEAHYKALSPRAFASPEVARRSIVLFCE